MLALCGTCLSSDAHSDTCCLCDLALFPSHRGMHTESHCVSALGLLLLVTTPWVVSDNRNPLPPSSGGRRVSRTIFSLMARGRILPGPFLASAGSGSPWSSWASGRITPASASIVTWLLPCHCTSCLLWCLSCFAENLPTPAFRPGFPDVNGSESPACLWSSWAMA